MPGNYIGKGAQTGAGISQLTESFSPLPALNLG